MKIFSHPLFLLITPGAIVGASILFLLSIQPLVEQYGPLLIKLPYLLLFLSAVISYRFNQWRLFYSSVLLLVCYFFIEQISNTDLTLYQDKITYHLLSIILPLNLLLLILRPERALLSAGGIRRLIIFSIQLSSGYLLFQFQSLLEPSLDHYLQLWGTGGQIPLPSRTLIFNIGLLLISLVVLNFRKGNTEACFTALIGCTLVSSMFFFFPLLNTVLYASCALLIMHSILANSHQMAFRDQLTRLQGRRALEERLKTIGHKYCVAMADVDHFKRFNDTYGHDMGDHVLKVVATLLDRVSGGGLAYRYGGEEFTLLFPKKDLDTVLPHLELLRKAIAKHNIYQRDELTRPFSDRKGKQKRGKFKPTEEIHVTISIGVAQASEHDREPFDVFKRADQALYHAKANGRNCVATENELP